MGIGRTLSAGILGFAAGAAQGGLQVAKWEHDDELYRRNLFAQEMKDRRMAEFQYGLQERKDTSALNDLIGGTPEEQSDFWAANPNFTKSEDPALVRQQIAQRDAAKTTTTEMGNRWDTGFTNVTGVGLVSNKVLKEAQDSGRQLTPDDATIRSIDRSGNRLNRSDTRNVFNTATTQLRATKPSTSELKSLGVPSAGVDPNDRWFDAPSLQNMQGFQQDALINFMRTKVGQPIIDQMKEQWYKADREGLDPDVLELSDIQVAIDNEVEKQVMQLDRVTTAVGQTFAEQHPEFAELGDSKLRKEVRDYLKDTGALRMAPDWWNQLDAVIANSIVDIYRISTQPQGQQ